VGLGGAWGEGVGYAWGEEQASQRSGEYRKMALQVQGVDEGKANLQPSEHRNCGFNDPFAGFEQRAKRERCGEEGESGEAQA